MTTLVILFIVALLGSSVAARIIVKSRGYDQDLFTLGGLLGGPLAIHAALTAERYAVEVDEEEMAGAAAYLDQPPLDLGYQLEPETKDPSQSVTPPSSFIAQPDLPPTITPVSSPTLAAPPLPEDGIPQPAADSITSPELQGLAAPPLPHTAPEIQKIDPNAPLPAVPEAFKHAAPEIKSMAPLVDNAPPVPKTLPAPSLPQELAPPVLPKEIPAPKPIVEPQDDEHKDPSVPAVANEKPAEQVAPQPRSLVDLISAEAPTQLRRGVEFYEAGVLDEETEPTYAEMLGKPDENGLPTEAVAPGESTCGMCPHCGHDSYADWYGLCVDCLQPFPVKVAWFDPTAPVALDVLDETSSDDDASKGKKKINLPGLKR